MITLRRATPQDAEAILAIYAYYIKHTAITFECEIPSVEAFRERISSILQHYPYLVAEKDKEVVGYAYATRLKDRSALDWSCETSIYIDKDHRTGGIGRLLYDALEDALRSMGLLNLYASIAYPTEENDDYLDGNSVEFHTHMGYRLVGEMRRCAFKFGRWYSLIWMEKNIGEHTVSPRLIFR